MSVYVDWLQLSLRTEQWPYKYHCHLFADSLQELHRFAIFIGCKKSWFQNKSGAHYDLTKGMRRKAIKYGAIEIKSRAKWREVYHRAKRQIKK
jgi:hypothetical protein